MENIVDNPVQTLEGLVRQELLRHLSDAFEALGACTRTEDGSIDGDYDVRDSLFANLQDHLEVCCRKLYGRYDFDEHLVASFNLLRELHREPANAQAVLLDDLRYSHSVIGSSPGLSGCSESHVNRFVQRSDVLV